MLGLINQVANQTGVKTGGGMFKSDTAMNLNLENQLKTLVLIGFGILNPLATKANKLASAYAGRRIAQSATIYDETINAMLESPEVMAEAMRLGAKDQVNMIKFLKDKLPKRFAQIAFVDYRNEDRDVEFETRRPVDIQTEELIPQ